MNKNTKITLKELIARKEQMLNAKKDRKTQDIYVASLDGNITIQQPDQALVREAVDMENGDNHLVYQCVIEPCLKSKELQQVFDCKVPMDIVDKIFLPGEIPQIAVLCMNLAGYSQNSVKAVDELKN